MLAALLFACVVKTGPPPEAAATSPEPVTFGPIEERVSVLMAESDDADTRARLEQARELMLSMRGKDPIAQRLVYNYLAQIVAIEERERPQSVAETAFDQTFTPIEEIPVEVPIEAPPTAVETPPVEPPSTPPVEAPVAVPVVDESALIANARALLAGSKYAEAADSLVNATTEDAVKLRREAIDGYARTEREAAGQAFIDARKLPAGAERDAAIKVVRERLAGINTRYPDNAFASQIAAHLARVDAELAGGSK